MKKKKILLQTDFSLAKTGFGRFAKTILTYLYKTGKYDLVHYCAGIQRGAPQLEQTPWKSIAAIPSDPKILEKLNRDPREMRMTGYGSYYLDEIIKEEKPDVYIASQDIWGVDFAINKRWFNKISSIIWTTLDSLPILPSAVAAAPKVNNYWIWSSFATNELKSMGFNHARTMHGPIDHSNFFKKSEEEKQELRNMFNIPEDTFLIGYVFRNQLRKSVPNLLEGYKIWRNNSECKKAGLLLHTHFAEGWNIMRLANEYNIDPKEIYCTYICQECHSYEIKNFSGQGVGCRFCGNEKSLITANTGLGITEDQLNNVYNLMDVYCHPFTSGGQEIPIQEAKFTELMTLVTNYSCGEDMCVEGAGSLPLEWSEYREHDTEFRKASTKPESIAARLKEVYEMPKSAREEFGKQAREWAIEHYSIEKMGPNLESIIDSFPLTEYDFDLKEEEKDPNAPVQNIENDSEWLVHLYKEILKTDLDDRDEGHQYWMKELEKNVPRDSIEKYFREVALKDSLSIDEEKVIKLLDKEDEGKRIIFAVPDSKKDVFLACSLLKSMKETYPEHNIYFATRMDFSEILDGNEYIHKILPFIPEMSNPLWLEGIGEREGLFDLAFIPTLEKNYIHNDKDVIQYSDSLIGEK
jgi:glycosyltransferase involved in cell wall biosynthesis